MAAERSASAQETPSKATLTAAEAANDHLLWERNTSSQQDLPTYDDSVVAHSRPWIATLANTSQRGLQLDAMGLLAIRAGDDSAAQRQFAERLATPGLSISDQAYTLYVATKAFTNDPQNTARLAIANKYVAKLDTAPLTPETMLVRFLAHQRMASTYYARRDSVATVREILTADAIIPAIPYDRRYWPSRSSGLEMFAEMVSSQPNARSRVDSLTRFLTQMLTASPALIAQDSAYYWMSQGYTGWIETGTSQLALLGKPLPGIVAMHWYGISAPSATDPSGPGARTFSAADGHVRVIEFGDRFCGACMMSLPALRRIRATAPAGVEFMYVTFTQGSWGADLIDGDAEAEHLRHFYLEKEKLNMPLAVWAGPKEPGIDDQVLPRQSPNITTIATTSPTFIVTDGRGIVRHVGFPDGAEAERTLNEKLRRLLKESSTTPPAATQATATLPHP